MRLFLFDNELEKYRTNIVLIRSGDSRAIEEEHQRNADRKKNEVKFNLDIVPLIISIILHNIKFPIEI